MKKLKLILFSIIFGMSITTKSSSYPLYIFPYAIKNNMSVYFLLQKVYILPYHGKVSYSGKNLGTKAPIKNKEMPELDAINTVAIYTFFKKTKNIFNKIISTQIILYEKCIICFIKVNFIPLIDNPYLFWATTGEVLYLYEEMSPIYYSIKHLIYTIFFKDFI